jgi:hypothetical protein
MARYVRCSQETKNNCEVKMKCKLGIVIVTLAAIGLLMAPALCAQYEKGGCKAHNGAMWMRNNLTEQELNNMTLGEIHALKQKEIQELNYTRPGNTRPGEFNDSKVIQNGEGCRALGDPTAKRGCNGQRGPNFSHGRGAMGGHGLEFLLMDNITAETLNNMTINQIHQLQQEKIQDLNNMTLAQIIDLKQKRMQDRENMTLGELKAQNEEMHKIAWLFMGFGRGIAGFADNAKDVHLAMGEGRHGMHGGGLESLNQSEKE